MDMQTILAVIIVVVVISRLVYKWIIKQKNSSGNCGCGKDNCE